MTKEINGPSVGRQVKGTGFTERWGRVDWSEWDKQQNRSGLLLQLQDA